MINDAINPVSPDVKYNKDGEFREPVVICDKCNKVQLVADLHVLGKCRNCGNTKVRNVRMLNDENSKTVLQWIKEGKVDPEWLKLFEQLEVNA